MGVVYDEVLISTMREIEVCRKEIRKLERMIAAMELKYNLRTDDFVARFKGDGIDLIEDFKTWSRSVERLKNWEVRLSGFQEILEQHRQ